MSRNDAWERAERKLPWKPLPMKKRIGRAKELAARAKVIPVVSSSKTVADFERMIDEGVNETFSFNP